MSTSPHKKTDKELWRLLRLSNRIAFSLLYKRHIHALFNFGLRLTSDKELIKDTLQELFVELWNKRNTLSDVDHIKVYLIKSLRYKLLRAISKTHKGKIYSLEELFSSIPEISIDLIENEDFLERKKQLQEALNLLSERQREVIHLRYFQNLKIEEIAEIININNQSVSNLLHRALTKLRASIREIKR